MPRTYRPKSHSQIRRRFALILTFAIFTNCLAPFAYPARQATTARAVAAALPVQAQSDFIRRVSLTANDVIYNPADQTLYASVPSSVGDIGNTIAPINPTSGEIGSPVFVGSEPGKLAMSDDGHSMYVFLEGAYAVRRFDTQTRTPGQQFTVGQDSFFGLYRANDLAVAPGNANLVAVARYYLGTSPPEAGVAVFDNGVQRTKTTPGHTAGANSLAFSATQTKLYGGGDNPLQTMTVDATGLTIANNTTFNVGYQIKFAGGLVYSSNGQVVNPDTGTLNGTFAGLSGTTAFVPDPAGGRAYYLTRDFTGGAPILRAFDINNYTLVGSTSFPGVTGDPTSLVRWGTNGLAFRTNTGQLYIVQTSLIPSSDPIPTPTPTPTATPTPSPTPAIATFVRQVSLATNDLIYNSQNHLLYASLPSTAGASGNGVTSINPDTAQVGPSVFVGSEPGKLALADDGHTMYVALNGAAAVRRLDTGSTTAGIQFSLGNDSFNGPYTAEDISVMPGAPGTVAVSKFNGGTAIYDDGVPRTQKSNFGGQIEFGLPTRLYVGSGAVQKLDVGPSGLTPAGSFLTASFGTTQFVNGLLYLSSGVVVDPEAGIVKGRYGDTSLGFSSAITVDPALGRVFTLTSTGGGVLLRSFDINTFRPIASVQLQGIGSDFGAGPSSVIRWGSNGLAFRTFNKIYLIQTALVDSADPIPTPTPTPSPTPTPTPTYVPTLVGTINLPANDLVINPATQTLYASVPSAAGANGNSITPIDPQTAAVGTSTFIGSEPGKLALADDGQTLYVNLEGASVVRRFDIPTKTPGLQFPVGVAVVSDMEVLPGSPQSLAVSRGTTFTGGVAIYDNGVQRPNAGTGNAYGIGPIEFGASPTTLYGYDSFSSGFELVKFEIDASGVKQISSTNNLLGGYVNGLKFAGGKLYSAAGRVVDPEAKTLIGTFNSGGTVLAVDTALGRAFFLTNNFGSGPLTLKAFDINTFLPLGSVTLPGTTGNPNGLVRWGVNGLAFCTVKSAFDTNSTSQVYLVQSALVSDALPIPSTVQFSASTYINSESNSTATVTVTRMGGVTGTASVNYATSDGTAIAGSDYTATSGTLNFADGQLSKTFTVPITDDNVFEGNETINLTLSNVTGGPTLGTPATAVLTIADNEFTPFLFVNSISVLEGDAGTTAANFNVTLSNLTTKTVTLNYATAPGTATADTDYVSTSGTLTFNPLEKTKQITVQVNGDTAQENNETFFLSLSNIVNTSNSTSQGTGTITDDDSPGFRFSAATYSVNEGDGHATLTVTRKGNTSTSASVNYQTIDLSNQIRCDNTTSLPGVAFARCDYATTVDTLTFAPGDTAKTFTIPIINDAHVESSETVQIVLSAPSGAPLASPSTAFLTIVDDDVAGGPNPIFDSPFFVRQHYLDFLSREPEPGGFQAWLDVLNKCSDVNNNPACDRLTVSGSFFGSDEFRLKGFYVFLFYKVALSRLPTYDEIIFNMRQVAGDTPEDVYMKRARLAQTFVQRQDFLSIYGGMNNSQFVSALLVPYAVTSINTTDPSNPDTGSQVTLTQAGMVDQLTNGTLTRAQVLRAVVQSREVGERESNAAFIAMQYYGYLRRTPEAPGFQNWMNYLSTHPGDFRSMVNGFMNSIEYRLRFGIP